MARMVSILRTRLREGVMTEYLPVAIEMMELARTIPGLVEAKSFAAEDGERALIVTFADRASHNVWRDHPRHREAQRLALNFYAEGLVQVTEETRSTKVTR